MIEIPETIEIKLSNANNKINFDAGKGMATLTMKDIPFTQDEIATLSYLLQNNNKLSITIAEDA